ncbi:hypothetical protein RH915_05935 [Serpentinicella sp. ANB-PHB4]|uniref:hypothetical protein n=1 Tax=Serpentinicella sp. ANB-PHB4 TaxID=3074076 RepID=UPI00285D0FE9|nr:hypothetical protein [Serpentinicella sp. ANB-PHB4]MDR5659023.1 hypothetical protein [Serpentinicella sp. ANB-PHB4]
MVLKKEWRLIPESTARVFPDYIHKAIITDYDEACLIVDKSPRAAASNTSKKMSSGHDM